MVIPVNSVSAAENTGSYGSASTPGQLLKVVLLLQVVNRL